MHAAGVEGLKGLQPDPARGSKKPLDRSRGCSGASVQLVLMAAGGCCGVGLWESEQRTDKVCICSSSILARGLSGMQVSSPRQSNLELGPERAEQYKVILNIKLCYKAEGFGRVEPPK